MIKVITNLIADGGISSKNSPNYSIESFLISKNKNYTFAIKSDVYQTKDNVFILLDDEIKKKLAINNSYIKSHTYCQLKKLNIGNKVKKHLIISLNELINISNNQDNIILNISDNIDISTLKNIINKNMHINWYISSYSLDMLEKLLNENPIYKTGIFIKDINNLNFSFDFYIIDKLQLKDIKVIEKLKTLNNVFIDNISSKKELNYFNKKNFFFISKHINKLN